MTPRAPGGRGRAGKPARPRDATAAGGRSRGSRSGQAEPAERPAPLELFGHHQARELVRAELARGTLARVLLVTGPRAVGKETFAFWIARLLLCEGPEPRPCGACSSCRKIAHLEHPDVHWFFPVPAESSFNESSWAGLLEKIRKDPLNEEHTRFRGQPASFRMHQAATIRKLAGTKSFEGGEQVFVLGNYEQNPSDQVHNALLKLFEEPPPRTTLVLTTSRLQGLPPTILSRCRPIRLRPLPQDEMRRFLAALAGRASVELDARREAEILTRAEGRPGLALELLGGQDDALDEATEILRAVLEGDPIASYGWVLTRLGRPGREELNRRLDALAALWRDLLRIKTGLGNPLARPDLLELYEEVAPRLDAARAAAAALEIEKSREQVQANVYAPLVFWKLFRTLAATAERPAASPPAAAASRR